MATSLSFLEPLLEFPPLPAGSTALRMCDVVMSMLALSAHAEKEQFPRWYRSFSARKSREGLCGTGTGRKHELISHYFDGPCEIEVWYLTRVCGRDWHLCLLLILSSMCLDMQVDLCGRFGTVRSWTCINFQYFAKFNIHNAYCHGCWFYGVDFFLNFDRIKCRYFSVGNSGVFVFLLG